MTGTKSAGVDWDNTIWPTSRVWATITGDERYDYPHIRDYGHPIRVAGGLEPFTAMARHCGSYEVMRRFEPFPGAIETLLELQGRGVELTLTTAREDHELDGIMQILDNHGCAVHAAVSRKPGEKVAHALEQGFDLLVDDDPSTIRQAHTAGMPIAGLRLSYNEAVFDGLGLAENAGRDWWELRLIALRLLGLPT